MERTARRPAWAPRRWAAAGAALSLLALTGLLGPTPVSAAPSSPASASGTPAAVAVPAGSAADDADEEADEGPDENAEQVVRIVLDDVDPTVAVVGERLVLRGRVVNGTDRGQRLARISAHAAWSGLTGRDQVTAWLAGDDTRSTPWHLGDTLLPPVVAAGGEVPFTLTVPGDVLSGVPGEQSVLAVLLEVERGELPGADEQAGDAGASLAAAGQLTLRTVLTATRGTEVSRPLALSWVVPLTLPAEPALVSPQDDVRLPAWHRVAGAGSVARTWLDHFSTAGVTWLVDPALLVAPEPTPTLLGVPYGGGGEEPAPTTDPASPDPTTGPTTDPTTDPTTGPASPDPTSTAPASPAPTTAARPTGDTSASPAGSPEVADDATTSEQPRATGETSEQTPPAEERPPAEETPPAAPPEQPTRASVESDLARLRGAVADAPDDRIWWLPTDDPDLAGLLALPQTTTTRSSISTAMSRTPHGPVQLERLLRRGRDDIAWPALQQATTTDLARLRAIWAARSADRAAAGTSPAGGGTGELAAVILPRETLSASSASSVGRAALRLPSPEGVTALAADTRASALVAASGEVSRRAGAGAAAQMLLADTLAGWGEAPELDRSMLVAPPRTTVPDAALLTELGDGLELAPWLRTQSAASLLSAATPGELTGGAVDPTAHPDLVSHVGVDPSPLDDSRSRILADLRRDLTGIGQVLTQTDGVRSWEPVLGSLWSTRWRQDRASWERSWRALRTDVADIRSGVHINPSTINFLSDQGVMRVTVVNSLPVAVEGLRVELVPGSSILQVVEQPEPFSIGADSRATVSFTALAVTRGDTTVTARLTAPNGTAFGDSAAVDVRVQPTGVWIYWVLGALAGVLLLVGVRRSLRAAPRASTAPPSQETE